MSLSIAERERILETVHESLMAFIYNELSGIPEIRQALQAQGLKLNIGIETGLEDDSSPDQELLASLGVSAAPPAEDCLDDWRNMGISLDDLREVAQTETQRSEEAVKLLISQIRELSQSLSPRGRNYSWGWVHLYYPEIGLGPNPVTVKDERFSLLSVPLYWQNLVEKVIHAVTTRMDKKQVLSRFLTTLRFAKANT